jgi:O-antigen/teichoic acid export membrane protein
MSTIRRQSIISSGVVYCGLALGVLTNFLLLREFNPDQYGLISGMFLSIGTIMYSFASMGMLAFISKFYPYYNGNLPPEKNDMMTWALSFSLGGFLLVIVAGLVFKGIVIEKYGHNSAALVRYYYWLFPFGLGLTLYSLLEGYAWQLKKPILTNYLREVQFRLITLTLIILYLAGVLGGFGTFVKLYSFNYLLVASILLIYLFRSGQLHFVPSVSMVTKKFYPKIRSLTLLAWSGGIVYNLSFFFAQIVIGAVVPGGLTAVGLYTMAQFAGSLIQAPQRGIMAASVGPLSQAWKDKDYGRINRIYKRSAITQLVFSVGMFALVLLNFKDGIVTFGLKPQYLGTQTAFIFISLARIVDMGTGVNTQIIGTSTYWRFDFLSGLLLASLTLPLNYIMAKELGIVGPAIADLITFTIYNAVRWIFLYRKFDMQPFTKESFYTILLVSADYFICFFAFNNRHGLLWLFIRSLSFLTIYIAGVLLLKLSDDVLPVWQTVKKRLRINGSR